MTRAQSGVAAIFLMVITLIASGSGFEARAADVAGSHDHPLVNLRYPEAQIYGYDQKEFEEHRLLLGKVTKKNQPTESLDLEGKVTTIDYWIPKHRSTLEVMRNYETALGDLGFAETFSCKDEECGGRAFNLTVVPYCCGYGGNESGQRYYAAKLDRAEGPVYVSLYAVKNYSVGGETKNRVNVRLVVIELKPMEVGMKVVSADEMRTALKTEGHVAIHSILFAFDSDEIQAESRSSLDEIG